jgi:hypothetical protein
MLSRGVHPVKTTFDLMRLWAVLTGLALCAWFFVAWAMGLATSQILPMLISAIGGFELMLYGQDLLIKRRRQNG